MTDLDLFGSFSENYVSERSEEMSLTDYLTLCKDNPMMYASAAERMIAAIGEPELVETVDDPRLSRIFLNRTIKRYPAFADFYGMEDTVEKIVGYFKYSAQGLEERKQILYLLGPVGGGKSSLAERLKALMEKFPVYVLKAGDKGISPIFESPLSLFNPEKYGTILEEKYGISNRYLTGLTSPWIIKRLDEFNGNLNKFTVVKMMPSKLRQICITKTEPGDENNQDISSLVGKVDIRKLEYFSQNDPDAYSYSGALNRSTQGLMEFVEMFKAPIKVLHPLLTATQESNYVGTENIGALPFNGVILAHCFSEDTELLTENGWRGIDEIFEGDVVATLNRENGKIEYQSALKKFVYNYSGDMYHMNSSAADHLVTPNHKMIYESYGNYKEVLAENFFVTGAKVPVSGLCEADDLDYYSSDDELRFHVWCVTDGNISYIRNDGSFNYRFHFNKDRKIERLSNLLETLNYDYNKTTQNDGTTAIYVNGVSPKISKRFSEIHQKLSPRQTTILLREWSHTDGSYCSSLTEDHFQIYSNVPFHRDLIQELCAKSGHKSTCAIANKVGYDPVFMMHIRLNTSLVRSDGINKGIVEYAGRVWCLETPNHTLVARRNGKVLITGNSNESEWSTFKGNKNNEAFLDRICVVKVPYCLQVSEEIKIYEKLLRSSDLEKAICAPQTLNMLSQFCTLTRLKKHENSNLFSKMRVYDGENLKDTDPKAKTIQEYRDAAGVDEGMNGISTRFAFKILSATFNYDSIEVAADPVHLMAVLENSIKREQFGKEIEDKYLEFIKEYLAPKYAEFIGNEIQKAYLESYSEYGQNLFDRYVEYADFYIQDQDYKDPDTGQMFNRAVLNAELEKIEKPAGIANPKDFRNEVVNFVLRAKAKNNGKNPKWTSYEKLREVIEKRIFSSSESLLPVITFGSKKDKDTEKKHTEFLGRMKERGYTERMCRRLIEWYQRVKKAG